MTGFEIPPLPTETDILEVIDAFCDATGVSATKFGGNAVGDYSLVANLRNGRSPTLRTARRVLDYIARQANHLALRDVLIASVREGA